MRVPIWIPLVVAALLALLGSVYTVTEGHGAIVLNLGRVVRTDSGPGLHFKWPLIQNVRYFDTRILTWDDQEPQSFITAENKPVLVDLRNIYRPADMVALGFTYESVGRGTI